MKKRILAIIIVLFALFGLIIFSFVRNRITEEKANIENEEIKNSIEDLTKLCDELTQKNEKLEKDMCLLLSLEPFSSASKLFSRRKQTGSYGSVIVVYLAYVRDGELYAKEIFKSIGSKPIEYKAVAEDISFTVVELVIGAEDAKEIVYLLVDKQKEAVTDISRWYKK